MCGSGDGNGSNGESEKTTTAAATSTSTSIFTTSASQIQSSHTRCIRAQGEEGQRDYASVAGPSLFEVLVGMRSPDQRTGTGRQLDAAPSPRESVLTSSSSIAGSSTGTASSSSDEKPSASVDRFSRLQTRAPPMAHQRGQPSATRSDRTALEDKADNAISLQFDQRALHSEDQVLVSHSLSVEPSPDPRYDLLITAESRCFSVVRINFSLHLTNEY